MKKKLFFSIIILVFFNTLYADVIYSPEWDFSLDLPEGFIITDSQDNARFQLEHPDLPVELLILSYTNDRYTTARAAMEDVFTKLQSEYDIADVEWRNETQSMGLFSAYINNAYQHGWAASVVLPGNKGTSVFLCYSPEEIFADCEQIIISCLDSICIDRGSNFEAGIFTQFAFPSEGEQEIELEVAGKKIKTTMDAGDIMANEFVIQREYAILAFYADSDLWKEAWQRYYRLIYRDSYKRFEKVAYDIYRKLAPELRKQNVENFDLALAQTLLSWVQEFEYKRIPVGTDFASLPSVINGAGSDCDSRAMLMCVLLDQMNYDTMLFVSLDYSHSVFGINLEGSGAKIPVGDKNYLVGETTAPVNLGQIAQSQSDLTKWIHIEGLQY